MMMMITSQNRLRFDNEKEYAEKCCGTKKWGINNNNGQLKSQTAIYCQWAKEESILKIHTLQDIEH